MRIKILKREFNGTEYCPEQRVLKLGGKNSAKVDKLEFELPEEWKDLAVSVHVQHQDGTLVVQQQFHPGGHQGGRVSGQAEKRK